MKNKKEQGASLIDVVTAMMIFIISAGVVISMYYQIYVTTVKTKIHQVAIGCITDVFEKIDLESYENVTEEKVKELIKQSGLDDYFNKEKNDSKVECTVTSYKEGSEDTKLDLVKKINITVEYTVAGKTTKLPINKIKIRE